MKGIGWVCLALITFGSLNTNYLSAMKQPLRKVIICIDAGHGITGLKEREPVAPGSSDKKPAHVSGTAGRYISEQELNLIIAMKLKDKLEAQGAKVIMTREENKCDLGNIERAEIANDAKADLMVRIHADGNTNPNRKGVSVLVPEGNMDSSLITQSRVAGQHILTHALEATEAVNLGVVAREDLTGFNWSKVPVVLIETGFLSNVEEEVNLISPDYQNKLADGISKGIIEYFKR